MKDWKIYTRTGDKGETALLGGRRVPKDHIKIEAYGTADELNAFIGLLRDQSIDPRDREVLLRIQDRVFVAESLLARGGTWLPPDQLHRRSLDWGRGRRWLNLACGLALLGLLGLRWSPFGTL